MNKRRIAAALFLVSVATLFTGCSLTKTPAAPPAPAAVIAYVDVDRAMRAMPQWTQIEDLERRINQLQAQAQQGTGSTAADSKAAIPAPPDAAGADAAASQSGLSAATQQEYDAKMADKQAQLQARLAAQADNLHQQQKTALDAYVAELDKQYQPQIFNLRLKLQTIQLTKEEQAAVQAQLQQLQQERNDKIAAKEQELAAQFDQAMASAQAAARQELAAYSEKLQQDQQAALAQQQAALAARAANTPTSLSPSPPPASAPAGGSDGLSQDLSALQAQRDALIDFLRKQVYDKASQLAAQKGYAVVITKPLVSINAVDITSQVIAEFRK